MEGTFLLSHWEMMFFSKDGKTLETSETYNCISTVERKKDINSFFFEIFFKNFKHWIFSLHSEADFNELSSAFGHYKSLKGPGLELNVPAFAQNILPFDIIENGWELYNPETEFVRMFSKIESKKLKWRISDVNKAYHICESYPALLALPKEFDENILKQAADHRDESRFPALSWVHPTTFSSITRCSQPLPGRMGNIRSAPDEKLIEEIFKTNGNTPTNKNKILDARPFSSAVANRYKGAGYEQTEFYQDCEIEFMGIENIHIMRTSLEKVRRLCRNTSANEDYTSWLNKLESTGWLGHVQFTLRASMKVAKCLHSGLAVVIHCSHGWDRTAQMSSIAQIVLDPYFRTIKGFAVLVEKEWVAFGHRVQDRAAHLFSLSTTPNEEESPIFLQFIDCVWQLMQQFPTQFEYNEEYLIALIDGFYNCKYGTFLANSEKERHSLGIPKKTISIWSFLYHPSNLPKYINPFYCFTAPLAFLSVSTSPNQMRFWNNLYERNEYSINPSASTVLQNKITSLIQPVTSNAQFENLRKTNETLRQQLKEKEKQLQYLLEKYGIDKSSIPSGEESREVSQRYELVMKEPSPSESVQIDLIPTQEGGVDQKKPELTEPKDNKVEDDQPKVDQKASSEGDKKVEQADEKKAEDEPPK